nr:putative ribonuclease H-like domain-containing protein [Tanacetum cinerariifolium]
NEHNCVACNKGKQHKASYKAISAVRTISEPLQLLHMDLFGPTSIRSIDNKYYSLVVTDDFSRFCWAFFLGTNDETFDILKDFIALIENQLNKNIKAIRCDNEIEFRNAKLIALCGEKGIKRDYSNARTPQQNGVAEQKNRTLIKAARSMLVNSKLPTMFWTEAVSTTCYVLNRVSITNPHNKTLYELLSGKVPNIRHLKLFGCQVTILNTSDHLGKFEGKANDGFLVGYAAHNKACRVYNLSNKKVEEMLNLQYLEDKPNVQGLGQEWYFDPDYLTDSLALLPQAKIEIQRNLVPAAGYPAGSIVSTSGVPAGGVPAGSVPASGVPAGSVPASSVPAGGVLAGSIVFTGGVPAGSVPASGVPTGSVPGSSVPAGGVLAGSIVSAKFSDPAASESVPALFSNAPAATSPLPHGHSLGSCEHTTRFPFPSDLGNHQPTAGILSSSSYDDDFCADVTNLASNVAVDHVATNLYLCLLGRLQSAPNGF